MLQVGTFEAKTHLSQLLEKVKKGEEITLLKRGVPIATLAPIAGRHPRDPRAAVAAIEVFRIGRRLAGLTISQL